MLLVSLCFVYRDYCCGLVVYGCRCTSEQKLGVTLNRPPVRGAGNEIANGPEDPKSKTVKTHFVLLADVPYRLVQLSWILDRIPEAGLDSVVRDMPG